MVGVGQDAQEMRPVMETALVKWASEDLMKVIWDVGAAGAPFLNYGDLFGEPLHPQVEATEIIEDVPHPEGGEFRAVISPWSRQGGLGIRDHAPPPKLGEHAQEILQSIGYDKSSIEALRQKGIVL
jgi:crotonobetainyl-CoA:carnitine CoA-transferase CaiB-like acyl-CoA transferase